VHEFAEALWLPEEAYADSYLLANAYGAAARELGVRFRTGVRVRLAGSGESVGIEFPESRLQPASVWVVAGAWSSRVLSSVGLCAPQAAVRSQYWVTGPTPLARPGMPIVLAPDMRFYARREIGSILFGLREPNGVAAADALLPDDLQGFVFDAADSEGQATLEAFAPWLDRFAPGLVRSGLKDYVAGPSCYTPDGEFLVGALSGWSNLRLLSGCNGAGVATSAGLADLAADIEAGATVASEPLLARFDPGRFGAVDAEAPEFQANCVATRAGKTSG
jgi:4-methylaminobutanoate oxidase (formaldehyde-forming)